MPRELKEVRNFNRGTILNASERDIPDNSAAFSLNVNPLSEHGILSAIKNDKIFASSENSYSTISTPISWGSPGFHDLADLAEIPQNGYQYVQVDNIDFAQEKGEIDLKFIGTKGKTEHLIASNIRPWMEKQFITYNSLDVMYEVTSNVGKWSTELPILTNTNAITSVGLATSDITFSGFDANGNATITLLDATRTNYDDGDASDYFTITTPDNHVVNYHFSDSHSESQTGTEITVNSVAGVAIGMSDGTASVDAIAENVKNAIEHANGHDERITITRASGVLTLTYAHKTLDTYLAPGDYIALVSQTGSGLAHWHEIIKIEDIDLSSGNLIVKRGCFGSRISTVNSGNAFVIYSNKMTIDQIQRTTKKGYFNFHISVDEEDRDFHTQDRYEWSKWNGNHIGGNSSFLNRAGSVLNQAKHGGAVTTSTSNHSMVFDATAKTVTFGSAIDIIPFAEGDTVTFYQNNDSGANNGFSAKIVKKIEASTGCVITLDTAPTSETESTQIYYMEANLLQNHTFHHQVDQTAPAQTISDTTEYKINHWAHTGYREESSGYIQNEYGYGAQQTDANVVQVDTGGFWTTSNGLTPQDGASNAGLPTDASVDQDSSFYPFTGADKYMKMTSEFVKIGYSSTGISRNTSSLVPGRDELFFNESSENQPSMFLSKGDVIKLTNDITWEYMRVKSIEGGTAFVERGIWGTTELTFANDASQREIWKCVNHGLQQKVSKDKLKPNQEYVLSFYAQDEDSNFTVANCDKTSGDATVDLDNGAETGNPIVPGMLIAGDGVPSGTTVASVTTTTQFEMSELATDSDSDTLTFYNPGQGGLSLRVNGGYINEEGDFQQFSKDVNKGHITKAYSNVTTEERWINFEDIKKENGDIAIDVNGNIKDSGLDNQWRKFSFTFKTPKKLLTDLTVDFSSKGPDNSIVSIDLADLRENTILINNSKDSSMSVTSLLDNGGIKDLVFWDSIKNKLGYMTDVFAKTIGTKDTSYNITPSPYTSSDLTSSKQTIIPNNREVHVGLGSSADDSNPQWLGYVNHKVFGQDFSSQIYQDEDTVHQYGIESAGTLSKISVAGEHEYLSATASSSGTVGDANTVLEIDHTSHNMNAGDNIIVREWGDVSNTWAGSGIWSVTSITSGSPDTLVCERLAALDADPPDSNFLQFDGSDTNRDVNVGKVCYRPYYYYGVRDGDSHIYRITPSDRLTGETTIAEDTVYVAGKIERSMPLRAPLNSICTCHSKKDESTAGQGGGKIYVSSNVTNDIYVVDVQVKYDEWTTTELSDSIIHPIYKSFKWSNDSTDGDVGGEEVFPGAGKAEDSSPTIIPSGILSDILETKGPNASYVHAATSGADNEPDHFDTRLWVQFRAPGDDTFGEGARFLFCGVTNSSNSGTGTEASIYFGDRTPPMNVLFGSRWDVGAGTNDWQFYYPMIAQRGGGAYHDTDDFKDNSDYTVPGDWKKYAMYTGWVYEHNYNSYDTVNIERIRTEVEGSAWYDYDSQILPYQRDFPYYQLGCNIGWYGIGGNWPSVKVAKYGLCPMADNDNDGVIDGTGVVVPSTTSITSNENPYGNLHQRVSAHCVGLIGGSEREWWRQGGKLQCSFDVGFWKDGDFVVDGWDNGPKADAPRNVGMDKCLFICSDMHYGDFQPPQEMNYTASEIESINGQDLTQFTLGTTTDGVNQSKFLQAGDCVYIKDITGTNYDTSATVMGVDNSNNKVTVDIIESGAGAKTGTIYIHTPKLGGFTASTDHRTSNHGVSLERQQMFHYAFDKDEPANGNIFTEGAACGHYSRKWYSKPNVPGGKFSYMPGILQNIERLDYRAGFMMRPFEATENTFEDLIVGNNTVIDNPGMPDAVYHVKNGSNLHKHVNDSAVNNQFASRLYISSPADLQDEQNKSKIYICDLNLNYPHEGNHIPSQQLHNPGNGDTSDDIDRIDGWDILARGTLSGTCYTSSSSTAHLAGATNNPVVTFTSGETNCNFGKEIFRYRGYTGGSGTNDDGPFAHRNGLAGLCLSIKDSTTGTIQTRYIVSSHTAGTGNTDHAYVGVHFPFGHTPTAGDKWYLSHHSNICTAPVRLLKEVNLSHGVGDTLNGDPTLSSPIFKDTGSISTIDGDGTTVTVTCGTASSTMHNLTTNDKIEITNTSNYNGIYSITVTSPRIFTFSQIDSTDHASESTGIWTLVSNQESSASNPIKVNLASPTLKTMFGGLDMRKSKSYTVTDVASPSASEQRLTTSANNLLNTGDVITFVNSDDAPQSGTYMVDDVDATNIDIENTDTSTYTSKTYATTTNQWEALVAERSSNARIGELRSGFTSWDKGDIQNNILRYDTDADSSSFMSVSEAGITVSASSIASQTGDFFKANTTYSYKVSFIYDGYQEGPLSESSWNFEDTVTRGKLGINIKISKYSNRLSHICVYRRDSSTDFYKLVEQVSTSGGWAYDGFSHIRQVEDDGTVGASYSARTGMSEALDTIRLKYGISSEIDGYLFAGDCSHPRIQNASNMVFRSRPGMFSIFDYANDFLTLKSKPTALVNFNGRLYVFDDNNIYKVNQETLQIEDIFEGIGCLNKDAVIVTEYGMFFADKSGAYMHNGNMPMKISDSIQQGGDTTTSFAVTSSDYSAEINDSGMTDNIKDVSWESIVTNEDVSKLQVTFLPHTSSVLFTVNYTGYTDLKGLSLSSAAFNDAYKVPKTFQYMWSYNVTQKRWDLWELSENSTIGKPFLGKSGELYIPIDETIYEYSGGSSNKDFTWLSKRLTMDEDSVGKVFNKIKLNGLSTDLNGTGVFNESSQRLIVTTSTGTLTAANTTYSSESSDHSTYRFSGANKKGRWIQFKLENMTESVDSIGVLFRRKRPK